MAYDRVNDALYESIIQFYRFRTMFPGINPTESQKNLIKNEIQSAVLDRNSQRLRGLRNLYRLQMEGRLDDYDLNFYVIMDTDKLFTDIQPAIRQIMSDQVGGRKTRRHKNKRKQRKHKSRKH